MFHLSVERCSTATGDKMHTCATFTGLLPSSLSAASSRSEGSERKTVCLESAVSPLLCSEFQSASACNLSDFALKLQLSSSASLFSSVHFLAAERGQDLRLLCDDLNLLLPLPMLNPQVSGQWQGVTKCTSTLAHFTLLSLGSQI